ncbi:hypothetical protein AAE478_007561 [Parahypoxylon ruwenzoriense]
MSPFDFFTPCEDVVEAFSSRIKGNIFLITGTTAGSLGANAAIALSRGDAAHIILVSRKRKTTEPVIQEISDINPKVKVTFVACDLSDFESVRKAAEQINNDVSHINAIINNAGVMAVQEYTLDKQGYETTLSANYLGHFLLTNLLMSKILAAGPNSRIVNVTSRGHRISPFRFHDYNFVDGDYNGWSAYGQSKTANILYSVELARRGFKSYSVHPGLIWGTGLSLHLTREDCEEIAVVANRNNGWPSYILDEPKTLSQGTSPLLAAALDPALEEKSGVFIEDSQIGQALDYAVSPENATKLWSLSEKLVGEKFNLRN